MDWDAAKATFIICLVAVLFVLFICFTPLPLMMVITKCFMIFVGIPSIIYFIYSILKYGNYKD